MSFITVFFIITILMILYKLRYKKISNKIPLFFKNTLRGMKWESDLLKNCENLSTIAPHFKVDPTNIKLYDEPSQFYEYLMDGVKNARERIFMSALYVGTDPMSKELISAIEKKCQTDQDVNVNILVDYLRGTRVEKGESTKSMLEGVLGNLQTYKKKPNFHFFLSPAFTGIWKKILPKRFNETLGVQHIKLYLFDDKMLISGANLSKDYFTNRQDRYVEISDKKLTDFYWDLLHTLSKNSFQLQESKELSPPAYHPSLEPEKFKSRFANDVKSFFENERWSENFSEQNKNELQKNTTYIFPTIQLGVCNVRQDEEVTNMVLSRLDEKSELVVTSGYFNLTDQYTNHLLNSRGKVSAIAASPLANGFFGSKGLSRHIPYAYTELELIFLKMVEKQNKQNNVTLNEYYRKDWTYHAKGVWSFRENSFMTLVGSPNFGYRSINRDLESQILIASDDPSLLKSFRHESSFLQQFSSPVQHSSLNVPDRRSALWVRLMIHFIKRFM